MKKVFLILNSAFLILNCTAQTNVSGFINANTTWNLAGSPYIVVSNALLSHGYSLTIDPGVVVKFNDSTALQIDGELHAVGTASNRITFTSNQPNPVAGDWGKIHFADTCENAVFDANGNYISGCIMKYCDVMYGGELGFGEIHIESSSPYFSQCRIDSSGANGIHTVGSSCLVDSSAIKNCNGYGLYFNACQLNSCGLTIIGDTLTGNEGGVYIYEMFGNCPGHATRINKNLFQSNTTYGAIDENIYLNSDSIMVTENYFVNNMAPTSYGIVDLHGFNTNTVIECNHFIGNQTSGAMLYIPTTKGGRIRYNVFDSNIATNTGGVSAVYLCCNQTTAHVYFSNNYMINNSSSAGPCCSFYPAFNNNHLLHVDHNLFSGNTGLYTVTILNGIIGSGDLNCLYMKHNNFLDQGSQIELNNAIAYGSPNLYIDSNYWGGTSTQHIDSVIYDYFDDANRSVVYYSPILTSPAVIDSGCPPPVINGTNSIEASNFTSALIPNPFTTQAIINFGKEVHNATFSLYNLLGKKVKTISGINGESLQIDRGNLQSGVYIFEVIEEEKRIGRGKAVIY